MTTPLHLPSIRLRFGLSAALLLGWLALSGRPGQAAEPAAPVPEKLVLTHTMHQMSVGAQHKPDETFLATEPSRANGIMALHTPEYLTNFAQPEAAAKQDLEMMRRAGVNAIALLLCRGHLKSQFASMIHAYYQAALADGKIKIAPDSWSGQFTAPEEMAQMYGELYARYGEAWLKHNGRLTILFWMDYGTRPLPPYAETVAKLFTRIGGRENVFLVLYSPRELKQHHPDWFAGADAFTDWLSDSYARSAQALPEARACATESGKEYWSPVMPSFQQSRYPHDNGNFVPNLREKLGASWFRTAWLAAIEICAPAVCLQTWNDLSEDSSVMPESNHGDAYYELNRYFAAWYQTGAAPAVAREEVLLFHHPQVVEGLRLPPGVKPMEGFPVAIGKTFESAVYHRTPPTDYIQLATLLKEPAEVIVRLNETELGRQTFPAGLNFWLLYQSRNQNDPQGRYACDPETVYPHSEPGLTVTALDHPRFAIGFPPLKAGYYAGFPDAEVYVEVMRGGERLGFYRSHEPLRSAAGRGNLTVIGDVFSWQQ